MKFMVIVMLALVMGGCVRATYKTDSGTDGEQFSMWSFFKSVDGLQTEKGADKFSMKIDKTHTQDPAGSILEILKIMQALQYGPPLQPPVAAAQPGGDQ